MSDTEELGLNDASQQVSGEEKIQNSRTLYTIFAEDHPLDDCLDLIRRGIDPGYVYKEDGGEDPLLTAAVRRGDALIVKALLDAGADPNREAKAAYNESRSSPLMTCLRADNRRQIARMLIDAGADVNYTGTKVIVGRKDKRLVTDVPVLYCAVRGDDVSMVELLLENGADPNAENVSNDGSRSSMLAECFNNENGAEVARLLIRAGADVNYRLVPAPAPSRQISGREWPQAERVVEKDGMMVLAPAPSRQIPRREWPLVARAVEKADDELLEILLSNGADPDAEVTDDNGMRVCALAVCSEIPWGMECARVLLAHGADVNRLTVRAGEDPEREGASCEKLPVLLCAIRSGDADLVQYLLKYGADPDSEWETADGSHICALAACFGMENERDMVQALVDAGADVNRRCTLRGNFLWEENRGPDTVCEEPVLFYAVASEDAEYVKLFLERGADPDAEEKWSDGSCCSALARCGELDGMPDYEDIPQALVDAGANINFVIRSAVHSENGGGSGANLIREEPLMFRAVRDENIDLMNILLDAGADPNMEHTDDSGTRESLLAYAVRNDTMLAVIEILLNAGADANYVIRTQEGDRPVLCYALGARQRNMVPYLLRRGADPNAEIIGADGSRLSLAAYCILNGEGDDVFRALINAGADVNGLIRGGNGAVPLLTAALERNDTSKAEILLEAGADPDPAGLPHSLNNE